MSRFSWISTDDDVAHLGKVGDGADRTLVGFERVDPDLGSWRSSAPRQRRGRNALIGVSARTSAPSGMIGPCADKIVGGAADRGRHQDAVGHQLVEPHDAVDDDPELGRLAALAQQRHLVEGERACGGRPPSSRAVISSGWSTTGCASARRSTSRFGR